MNKNALILTLFAIVMAGCASPYAPPVSGPTAKLTLPLRSDEWGAANGGGIQLATRGSDGCGKLSQGIVPKTYDKDFNLTIAGNSDMFFSITRFYGNIYCIGYGEFHASPNNEYVLNIVKLDQQRCVVSVIEINQTGVARPIKVNPAATSQGSNVHVCETK